MKRWCACAMATAKPENDLQQILFIKIVY